MRRNQIGGLRRRVADPRMVDDDEHPCRLSFRRNMLQKQNSYSIVTIEEATSDGHGSPDDDEVFQEPEQDKLCNPIKRPRPPSTFRTIAWLQQASSDARGRRRSVYLIISYNTFIDLSIGVLYILDAATNDLALLINTLNLQATPSTPDLMPFLPSSLPVEDGSPRKKEPGVDTPLKKTLRSSMASISPLRPCARSHDSVKPPVSTTNRPANSPLADFGSRTLSAEGGFFTH